MKQVSRITFVVLTSTVSICVLFAIATFGLAQLDIANNAVLNPWKKQIIGFAVCLVVWIGLYFSKKQLCYLDGYTTNENGTSLDTEMNERRD